MVTRQQIIHWSDLGMSQRAIARKAGISRETVRKVLAECATIRKRGDQEAFEDLLTIPPRYNSSHRKRRVLTPKAVAIIDECLQENKRKKRQGLQHKWCMRKCDIWERLKKEGCSISYSTVCHYIYAIEHAPAEREKEAYIRQEYRPGETCEFDWGDIKLVINGKEETYCLAVFTFAFSNARWAYLFHHQDTLAFMESHRNFFRDVHGIPRLMVYDNMRVAVKAFKEDGKEPTEALRRMEAFYLFDHRFCNIRSGNEKGHVERSVEYVRRKAFCVNARFETYDAAQKWLMDTCLGMPCKAQDEDGNIVDLREMELAALQPNTAGDMGCFDRITREVNKWSAITFENNHYSVPDSLVGKSVIVKIYSEHLTIWDGETKVARHERSYAKEQWILDIDHYLKTFSRKPGALRDSTALRRADAHLRELFEKHFVKNAKGFIELLVFAKENKRTHQDIIEAYNSLFEKGFRKISVEQIRAVLNHENISDDVYTMTTQGGAHAQQIEQKSAETLDQVTQLITPLKEDTYATDTQRFANH